MASIWEGFMHDWRNSLQSRTMRNVVVGMFALNAAGIYAAYEKLNQPAPEAFSSFGQATPIAYGDPLAETRPLADLPPVTRREVAWESRPAPLPSLRVIPDATPAPVDLDRADEPAPQAQPDAARPAAQPQRLARLDRAQHVTSGFEAAFSPSRLESDVATPTAADLTPVADAVPTLADQPSVALGTADAVIAIVTTPVEPSSSPVASDAGSPSPEVVSQTPPEGPAAPPPTSIELPASAGTQG
jgi:hypothetical protein